MAPTRRILLAFLVSLAAFLTLPQEFPLLRLNFFIPFMIITIYSCSLFRSLWYAIGCGVVMDIIGSDLHFGLFALNYTICTIAIYPQKKHFFEDSLTTIPVLTFAFSVLSTLLQLFLMEAMGGGIKPTSSWILTDLILMPLADGLYGFLLFTMTGLFMPKQSKHEYFLR